MAWKTPSWLDEVASAAVPAGLALGSAYLGGNPALSRTAIMSAVAAGSKGLAEKEAQDRARKFQKEQEEAEGYNRP